MLTPCVYMYVLGGMLLVDRPVGEEDYASGSRRRDDRSWNVLEVGHSCLFHLGEVFYYIIQFWLCLLLHFLSHSWMPEGNSK